MLWVMVLAGGAFSQEPRRGATAALLLTNLEQVVTLDPVLASSNRYSARVSGVVTYVSELTTRIFLQEGDRGIQVTLAASNRGFRAGQRVEATGAVEPGRPYPTLARATATVLGTAPLPGGANVTAHQLSAGAHPFCMVTTRAIVRDMTLNGELLVLLVSYDGSPFEVWVSPAAGPLPREWIDAEIQVTGMAFQVFNARGRVTRFDVSASSTDQIKVIRPGPGTLFDRPLLSIADAAKQPQEWGPRYRFSGVVTYFRPGLIYLQDTTGVMLTIPLSPLPKPASGESLEHEPQTTLEPGERIEVIGARRNWYSLVPTAIFSEYRRLGRSPVPAPQPVSVRDLQAGRFPGRVVSIEGQLLNQRGWGNAAGFNQLLTLRVGEEVVQASWSSETPADWKLKTDSYVRVTGVHESEGGVVKGRPTFQLLMRSPGDVVAAVAPPFWTRPQVWKPGLVGLGVGVIAMGWIFLLRRQMLQLRASEERLEERVAERTAELLESESALLKALEREKELNQLKSNFVSLVSHEFRTPLEVILTSSDILDRYLDRLTPERRANCLGTIRSSVKRMGGMMEDVLLLGRVEAGRLEFKPEPVDLPVFCERIVDEILSATLHRCPIELRYEGDLAGARGDETLLRHLLTNLLSNGVKYSPPDRAVRLEVARAGRDVIITVADQGRGIPESDRGRLFQSFQRGSNVSDTPGTGLGLLLVQKCVDVHGGSISFESEEGRGTSFRAALPLFAHATAASPNKIS